MTFQRIRTDFTFAVLVLLGLLLVVSLVPFAIYRLQVGPVAIALIDFALVLVVAGAVAHAWRGGRVETAGRVVTAVLMAGYLGATVVVGGIIVAWGYPLLLAGFLITGRRWAAGVALAGIAGVLLIPGAHATVLEAVVFTVTALLTSAFAFVFAQRTGRQHEHLHRLATHDDLTGALNRRSLRRELQAAIDAAGGGARAGLAILDLDHFKRVNDDHGHDAGDRVLAEFARLVRGVTRHTDRFFRLGGEEFLLLLPGADAAALQLLCESLRQVVGQRLEVGGAPVTVSIGAAVLRPGETADDWLARADRAMYRAKREGRDRVVVDGAPAPAG